MIIINSGIKDLWVSINEGGHKEELERQIFELSRLLFESGIPEASILKAMDKDDLTDLLLECQLLCRATQQFFTDSLPHIDPEFKGESLEEKLAELRDSMGTTIAEIVRISEANQKLFEAEEDLRRRQRELQSLKARTAELEEMEREVQPERLADELAKATGKENELIRHAEAGLSALINRLSSPTSKLHLTANQEVLEKLRQGGQIIPADLTDRMDRIQKELDEFDDGLKSIISQRDKFSNAKTTGEKI